MPTTAIGSVSPFSAISSRAVRSSILRSASVMIARRAIRRCSTSRSTQPFGQLFQEVLVAEAVVVVGDLRPRSGLDHFGKQRRQIARSALRRSGSRTPPTPAAAPPGSPTASAADVTLISESIPDWKKPTVGSRSCGDARPIAAATCAVTWSGQQVAAPLGFASRAMSSRNAVLRAARPVLVGGRRRRAGRRRCAARPGCGRPPPAAASRPRPRWTGPAPRPDQHRAGRGSRPRRPSAPAPTPASPAALARTLRRRPTTSTAPS